MQVGTMLIPMKVPVDVREHYGLSDFSVFQNNQATVDARPQYGSSHNRDVGGVISSPYMPLLATTVAPKKQVDKSRNKTRNANILAFDLGKAVVDDEVMITCARATDDYVLFENMDPNKIELVIRNRQHGARFIVAKVRTASLHPWSKMFVIAKDQHIRGMLDGSTRPYPSWDDVDWVYMSINAEENQVVTCWLIDKFCGDEEPRVQGDTQAFFDAVKVDMLYKFHNCRCEDTEDCGYD
nr:hypothetical protein [Tanacetum cinerariifolium]